VVTGISHCIVYSARSIGSQACDVYVTCNDALFRINCFGIELVLCNFKLYLMKFVLTNGLLSDIFFIAFFMNCVVAITEYLHSNHFQYQ